MRRTEQRKLILRIVPAAVCLAVCLAAASASAADGIAAFPGASGFGSSTTGGSGRHLVPAKTTVYRIVSLADSGPNTLRACASASGPRVCIFETSGRIELSGLIEITEPYLTIAGQTAPDPGIMIAGAGLKISSHDIVIRHLAVRIGDAPNSVKPSDRDGVTVHGGKSPAYNILLDHLSLTWAVDENMDVYGEQARDITVMNSIIAEGLFHSVHTDGPHSMGVLINEGAQRISIHDCLLAHNNDRNPRQKAGSSLEFLNNVVYDWGGFGAGHEANPSDTAHTNRPTLLNFAGNYYLPGKESPKRELIYVKPASVALRIYVEHNIGPTRLKDEGSEWTVTNLPETPYRSLTPAFPPSGVKIRKPEETLDAVLAHAGTRPMKRDSVDARIVGDVKSGKGGLKNCVSGCSHEGRGYPEMKAVSRKLTLPADPDKDSDGNGYTNLEDWLNCYARQVEEGSPADCG